MPQRSSFSFTQSLHVVLAIGSSDFALKYRGSVLGFLWSFIVPLMKFFVIFHVFNRFIQNVPHYKLYLFLGLILWEHFALLTSACMTMVHDKAGIIQKVIFPRILLIYAVGWTHGLIFLSYMTIFLLIAFIMGISATWGLLYILLIFLQATLLALAVGMILSAYTLKYRDLQHLWEVSLQIIFWLTPIIYAYTPQTPLGKDFFGLFSGSRHLSASSFFDIFIRFQPLSILMHDARRAILYPTTLGVPSALHATIFTAICIGLFLIGATIFRRRSRYFVQEY